jgi:hypothetical protein
MINMKRTLGIFLCLMLITGLLGGCGDKKKADTEPGKTNNTSVSNPSSDNTSNTNKPNSNTKAKVFKPDELLSAEEASAIIGTVVTLEDGSLNIDNTTGTSSTYYDYELTSSTTLAALFRLVQNGAIPKDKLEAGNTAASSFENELKMCGDNAEALNGLGDKAFVHKNLGQVNVLYKDYYILVGFGEDSYNSKDLNIKVVKKILENIEKKK